MCKLINDILKKCEYDKSEKLLYLWGRQNLKNKNLKVILKNKDVNFSTIS